VNLFYAISRACLSIFLNWFLNKVLGMKFALENNKKKYEGSGDVFRYAQSDVVLKHSDVLHLWRKVMLSLPFTAPTGATSL